MVTFGEKRRYAVVISLLCYNSTLSSSPDLLAQLPTVMFHGSFTPNFNNTLRFLRGNREHRVPVLAESAGHETCPSSDRQVANQEEFYLECVLQKRTKNKIQRQNGEERK